MRIYLPLLAVSLAACRSRPPAQDTTPAPEPLPSVALSTGPLSTAPLSTSASSESVEEIERSKEFDRLDALSKSPEGALVRPCPKRLASGKAAAGTPALDLHPRVSDLIRAARNGQPERVRLWFRNSTAECSCPEFEGLALTEKRKLAFGPYLYVVFSRSVVNGYFYVGSRYEGETQYLMVGYYTGRFIDHYEWHRQQTGQESGKPDETTLYEWQAKHPEFCVESWCAIFDKNPASHFMHVQAAEYPKYVAKLLKAGVVACEEKDVPTYVRPYQAAEGDEDGGPQ